MAALDDAQALWDYHQMGHRLRPTDIAIGLGSHDIGVAEHTAHLYHQGLFPLIVFTGANASTTVDVFPRGEAVHFTERAIELGVPADAILTETRARNTGDNFTLTRQLLRDNGVTAESATIVSRPYQQRRAYATCRKLWPKLEVICSSRPQPLDDYIRTIGDESKVLNMLVGDTQRIWLYADQGFAVAQEMPNEVRKAYERLLAHGYSKRVLTENADTRTRLLGTN